MRSGARAQLPSSLALNSRLCAADDDDAYVCFGLSWSVDRAKGEFDVKFRLGLFKEKPGHRGMFKFVVGRNWKTCCTVYWSMHAFWGEQKGPGFPGLLYCLVLCFFPLSLFFPPFIILKHKLVFTDFFFVLFSHALCFALSFFMVSLQRMFGFLFFLIN